MLKNAFCTAAAVLLLLTSCSGGAHPGHTAINIPGDADAAAGSYILALSGGADDVIINAAENFCNNVSSLSNGGLALSVERCSSPLNELHAPNDVKLAIVDGKTAEGLHPFFALLNEPFNYRSYEIFSMTLNSSDMLKRLSEASGLNVISAYYTGSCIILSREPLDKAFSQNIKNNDGEALLAHSFALAIPGTGTARAFKLLEIDAAEEASIEERFDGLINDGAAIEVTTGELLTSSLSLVENELGGEEQDEGYVLTRSFHTAKPAWLLTSLEFYESLSPLCRAAVDDATALVYGDIDKHYLTVEALAQESLMDNDFTVSTAFGAFQSGILSARLQDPAISSWEKEFREFIGRIV